MDHRDCADDQRNGLIGFKNKDKREENGYCASSTQARNHTDDQPDQNSGAKVEQHRGIRETG
ncbi:hypothetical protein GCM10011401_04860 [Nesterenkonia cremea]|uniref:Uncharacterized protein n=1 Tax=Nesterenkonia cremea TaxID=1882340 RepID=A0A917AMU8_9MICC|nr:hypothetical protein GCM10011401_04860 [Nesterenkonia cremea]